MPTLIFPMLLVLMLGACASKSPPPPTWVMGDSDAYSNTQYLLGRGQAATAEEAKDRARADIAKVFSGCRERRQRRHAAFQNRWHG